MLAYKKKDRRFAYIGMIYALLYMGEKLAAMLNSNHQRNNFLVFILVVQSTT